jgi:preprotein translocase subunit YajC
VQGIAGLLPLILIFGLFYLMLIRPQRRRAQQHQSLVNALEPGDEVVTIGGLYGTVTSLDDDDVELEVSPGTTLRFVKSAVARKVTEDVADEDDYDYDESLADEGDDEEGRA